MGCSDFMANFAKYILFIFNFIIFVCSVLLIVFGVLLLINENLGTDSFDNWSISKLAIALGALVLLISFFGCYGAIKEIPCLLTTYAVILITLFIIQIVLGIIAFIALKNDDGAFDTKIREFIVDIYNTNDTDEIDFLQNELSCCNADQPYWSNNYQSCCENGADPCNYIDAYKQGCIEAFKDVILNNSYIIGGIAIGFCVVELLGAIFAFWARNA